MKMEELRWYGDDGEFWLVSQNLYHKTSQRKVIAYKRNKPEGYTKSTFALWYPSTDLKKPNTDYYDNMVDFAFHLSFIEPLTPEGK